MINDRVLVVSLVVNQFVRHVQNSYCVFVRNKTNLATGFSPFLSINVPNSRNCVKTKTRASDVLVQLLRALHHRSTRIASRFQSQEHIALRTSNPRVARRCVILFATKILRSLRAHCDRKTVEKHAKNTGKTGKTTRHTIVSRTRARCVASLFVVAVNRCIIARWRVANDHIDVRASLFARRYSRVDASSRNSFSRDFSTTKLLFRPRERHLVVDVVATCRT
jgi:hypothetical protein